MDYGTDAPAVAVAFNTNCVAACTVKTCSCTQSDFYWSATTLAGLPGLAWTVRFNFGGVFADNKTSSDYVRAVRSGLFFAIGARVQVTENSVNLRSTAGGTVIGTVNSGNQGNIIGGPQTVVLSGISYTFWDVNFGDGVDGWVPSNYLALVVSTPE